MTQKRIFQSNLMNVRGKKVWFISYHSVHPFQMNGIPDPKKYSRSRKSPHNFSDPSRRMEGVGGRESRVQREGKWKGLSFRLKNPPSKLTSFHILGRKLKAHGILDDPLSIPETESMKFIIERAKPGLQGWCREVKLRE